MLAPRGAEDAVVGGPPSRGSSRQEPMKGLTSIADAATRHLEGALKAAKATDSEARRRAAATLDEAERDITSFNDTARGLM